MTAQSIAVLLLAVLALGGAAAGIVVAFTGHGRSTSSSPSEPGLLRITAAVHTGWEQTLIGLYRELALPRQPDGLSYGEFYLESQNEQRLLIRSRSEIGRGFIGVTELHPGRRATIVRYTIRRLPGDEQLRDRVLDLELDLITALRRIDRDVEVQLTSGTLRELERQQQTEAAPDGGPSA